MKTLFSTALFVALISAAACSPPAQQGAEETATDMSAMENAAPDEGAAPIQSTGVVTAVDATAGTISLDHEAIPAVSWPAMSMQFTAEDPAILRDIAVGDRVMFQLKSATETSVVTMVHEQ
jgi:Cu/Ag efflux protein CusF